LLSRPSAIEGNYTVNPAFLLIAMSAVLALLIFWATTRLTFYGPMLLVIVALVVSYALSAVDLDQALLLHHVFVTLVCILLFLGVGQSLSYVFRRFVGKFHQRAAITVWFLAYLMLIFVGPTIAIP